MPSDQFQSIKFSILRKSTEILHLIPKYLPRTKEFYAYKNDAEGITAYSSFNRY